MAGDSALSRTLQGRCVDEQELKNECIDQIPDFSHSNTRVLLVSSSPGWASLPGAFMN